jgi:SUN domain-containing protein 1/2
MATLLASGFHIPQSNGGATPLALESRIQSLERGTAAWVYTQCSSVVNSALLEYSKDIIGKKDYALRRAGAIPIPLLTSPPLPEPKHPRPTEGSYESRLLGSASMALNPDLQPGSCWFAAGSSAHLGIALSTPIIITHVTIDNIAKELAPDVREAPRSLVLWGLLEGTSNIARYTSSLPPRPADSTDPPEELVRATAAKSPGGRYLNLAEFEYNPFTNGSHVQTFPIQEAIIKLGVNFGIVALEIKSNWGAETTCLYRVRIHGIPGEVFHAA